MLAKVYIDEVRMLVKTLILPTYSTTMHLNIYPSPTLEQPIIQLTGDKIKIGLEVLYQMQRSFP